MNLLKALGRLGGRERGPAELARWLGLPEAELRPWLGTAPAWTRGYDYTRFTIPKRRGGTRTIDAPGDKLKALQRRVQQRLLAGLKLSPAATGYVRGRSIVDNARPHTQQAVVMSLIVLGEAATKVMDQHSAFAADHNHIPWRSMRGMPAPIINGGPPARGERGLISQLRAV